LKKYLVLNKDEISSIFSKRIFDIITIICLLIFSTVIFIFSTQHFSGEKIVYIKYNNHVLKYPLKQNREIKLKNGKIVIEIKNKKVHVKESDCPEKICVLTGWISNPGQIIVCVPNKLIIKIISEKEQKIDSISR